MIGIFLWMLFMIFYAAITYPIWFFLCLVAAGFLYVHVQDKRKSKE